MNNIRLSFHARQRMAEWGFTELDVRRTIRRPRITWPGHSRCIEYVGAALIATVGIDGTVVTVKLVSDSPYEHTAA